MSRLTKQTVVVLLGLSFVCFFGCSGDDDDDDSNDDQGIIDQGEVSPPAECNGVWTITSAVLDGQPYETFGAVWTITPESWTLNTVVCSSSGTTVEDGENISMTVSSQDCADPIPAPEGRTASGTCTVNDNVMSMTLSHDLEGTVHTLTVTGQ